MVSSGLLHGSMMAVGLSKADASNYLHTNYEVTVACINSPHNITLSGASDRLNEIEQEMKKSSVFVRRLKVNIPYHTHSMKKVAKSYEGAIRMLKDSIPTNVKMFSSD